jgi:hypothetical protein
MVAQMDIKKFYTKDVEMYEQMKALITEVEDLRFKRHFIDANYDSKIHTKIEASSSHNFNEKTFKRIELPVDVILEFSVTKAFVLNQIDKRIEKITAEIRSISDEFDKLKNTP